LRVDEQVQRVNGEYRKGVPKSNAGKRTLTLPPPLTLMLKAHRAKQNAERLAAAHWADNNLVFCTTTGGFLNASMVTHLTQRQLEKAGLPRLTFHELRHSAGTLLGAQGLALHEIADILGHTDIRTARIYTHTTTASRQKAADVMGALLGESMGG
jgi:integrase